MKHGELEQFTLFSEVGNSTIPKIYSKRRSWNNTVEDERLLNCEQRLPQANNSETHWSN